MTSRPAPERSSSIVEKMKFRRRSDNQTANKKSSKDEEPQQTQANMSANLTSSTNYSVGSGDWSDVTITCKSSVWRLHKDILMLKCDYFRDRCLAEQENTPVGQPIAIGMDDEDPQVVEALLRYLYTGDMDWTNSDRELHPYHFYALVFKMAVKFKIPRLATLALEPIELTEISRIDEELQEAVPDLYAMRSDGEVKELRETMVRKTARPWGVGMLNFPTYKELIATVPEFALDTIAYLAKGDGHGEMSLPIQNGPTRPQASGQI